MDAMMNSTAERVPNVMVVEDEALLVILYEDAIRSAGANSITAYSLDEGLEAIHDSIDVAILDIRLGEQKVFPIAYRLLEIGVPFLFCSGTVEDMPKGAFSDVPLVNKPAKAEVVVSKALSLIKKVAGLRTVKPAK